MASSGGSSEASTPTRAVSRLSIDSDLLPPQKRAMGHFPGKEGRPCLLTANHFQISLKPNPKLPNGVMFMYNISIVAPWSREYRRGDRPLYQRIIQKWKETEPRMKKCAHCWVYDGGKILYSTREWKGTESLTWTVKVREEMEEEREVEFTVKDLQLVKRIPVSQELAEWAARGRSGGVPQDSIHLLDVLLSQAVALDLRYETIGRSSYLPTKGTVLDIGFGKEVWTGLFSSVRPLGWKEGGVLLTLNVDVSNKPATKELHLTKGSNSYTHQVLQGARSRAPVDFAKGLSREQVEQLERDMKGLKVRYELPNGSKRSYRVNGFKEAASRLRIPELNLTVVEYFKKTYRKSLEFPNLPCLWLGSKEKTIYIPMEFCSMVAQALPRNKALAEDATAKMIRGTAVNPLDRQKKILEGLRANNDLFRNDPYAKEFGINVAGSMSQIKGRILAPPSIAYSQTKPTGAKLADVKTTIDPKKPGSWQQPKGMSYCDGKVLKTWAVLDLARTPPDEYSMFLQALARVGQENGLTITCNPADMWKEVAEPTQVERALGNIVESYAKDKIALQMVVVILPFKGGHVYDKVKHLGDVRHKVPTQCVIKKNLFKPGGGVNFQVLGNLCLKINSKLGGINHVLHSTSRPPILKRPIMIMGADVTHPAPEHKGSKPSIAAVVASIDPRASRYEVQVRVQATEQNEEVIHDMKEVTMTLLKRFKEETNGRKPEKIVMFRDGVSEGQFLIVLAKELCAIRAACTELEQDYKPEITYVVVQKRHHTRFFPADNNQYHKNNNALAGTVVDQGINHPTEGDFYLLSHEGIQGTSRPCHYQVLWDDSNLSADALETLSYYLCHLYSRCTRSVSYPTPTYYSHLAADRARKHHNELILARESPERAKHIIENAKINMMYFV